MVHPAAARATASTCSGRSGGPFEVDPRTQHVLLVAGGLGIAGVRALADEAIRDGRQVTLLFGGAGARDVYPSSLLPDEVEYVVATDDGSVGHHGFVTELMPEYEAWADQAFACGPLPMLRALASLASTRRRRLGVASLGRKRGAGRPIPAGSAQARRKAFLQVSMEQNMGCAVGACLGCVVMATSGDAAARLPRGPGLRLGRARLGERLVKAKRRVVTSGANGADEAPAHRAPDQDRAIRPLVRRPEPAPTAPTRGPARRASVRRRRPPGAARPPSAARRRPVGRPRPRACASRTRSSSPRGRSATAIEYGDVVEIQRLGAICCKGTTLRPRIGNPTPRVTETPGGMLNSIGLQNPGVDAVIEKYAATWSGWRVPVIVNVAGESIADYTEVARRLDGVPGIAGIELNISCPNVGEGGIQFAIDAEAAGAVTAAVRRATDLPLLVKLSPNVADVRPIARAIADAGADALTAINTLSGHRRRDRPRSGRSSGTSTAACPARRSSPSRCGSCTRSARSSTSRSSRSAA